MEKNRALTFAKDFDMITFATSWDFPDPKKLRK